MSDINITCKYCGHSKGYIKTGEIHNGLYCAKCNKWIKWISKSKSEIVSQNDDLEEEIDIISLTKQRDDLTRKINKYYELQVEKEISKNSNYIGKVFKKKLDDNVTGYYKIIDVDNTNQFRMNTLVFTLPAIQFKCSPYNFNELTIMDIDSIGWFCNTLDDYAKPTREIDLYTEISNNEYLEAFNTWNDIIKNIIEGDNKCQ